SAASETKTILLNEEANPKEPLPTPTWTMHSVKNTEIKLEWSKVEDALNYTVYYKESTASKFQQLVASTNSTTYYGIKNRTYDFFVVANPKYNDGNAASAASETKTILLNEEANPKEPLATPTWTNVSASKTKISLSWNEVDGALNYSLFYKEATAKNFVKLVIGKTSTTYYGIKGKTYEFYLVANPEYNNGYEVSAASETKTITLDGSSNEGGSTGGGSNEGGSNEGDTDPTKTPIAAPVLSWKVDGTTITVSWSEDKTEKTRGYKVFWKVKGANGDYQASNEIDGTSHQITGVAGQTYEIYAVAYPKKNLTSEYRYSENSKTVTATIPKQENPNDGLTPLPNAKLGLTSIKLGYEQEYVDITLTYVEPDGLDYKIQKTGPLGGQMSVPGACFAVAVEYPDGTVESDILEVESYASTGQPNAYNVQVPVKSIDVGKSLTVYVRPYANSYIQNKGYTHAAQWCAKTVGKNIPGDMPPTFVDPNDFIINWGN
ncbi:MAG: hypothetical protein IJZ10_01635, partial [Thermoguttaceae bacterium]|nr:hypothetical protein [Thermoguttaceae bacterium]